MTKPLTNDKLVGRYFWLAPIRLSFVIISFPAYSAGELQQPSIDKEIEVAHAYGREALKALMYINSGLILALVALAELSSSKIQIKRPLIYFGIGAGAAAASSMSFFASSFLYVRILKGNTDSLMIVLHGTATAFSIAFVFLSLIASGVAVWSLAKSTEEPK